ncbi:MAG: SMP-30/gluconolactonase/LRE family protein [Gemmatimonadota bacterium]
MLPWLGWLFLLAALTGCDGPGRPEIPLRPEADPVPVALGGDTLSRPLVLAGVGFDAPETVLYDERADVYLVSNVGGGPWAEDGDGFVSRVSPDGRVLALKWIDGAAEGVQLDGPKGMAFRGDSLLVADIEALRVFDRRTGRFLGSHAIMDPGLNDVAVGPDGTVWVSSLGPGPDGGGTEPDSTAPVGGVYRLASGTLALWASGPRLARPDGIEADGAGLLVAPFASDVVYRLGRDGEPRPLARMPAGRLDGLLLLPDGSLLVSSWQGRAVYRLDRAGGVAVVAAGLESPAQIGWDRRRGRLLVPLLQRNEVRIHPAVR